MNGATVMYTVAVIGVDAAVETFSLPFNGYINARTKFVRFMNRVTGK